MPRQRALASYSVQELVSLRAQVNGLLQDKRQELEHILKVLRAASLPPPATKRTAGPAKSTAGVHSHPRAGVKVAAKYRDDKGNSWSGRGLMPNWMKAALKRGGEVEDFLIGAVGAVTGKLRANKRKGRSARHRAMRQATSA